MCVLHPIAKIWLVIEAALTFVWEMCVGCWLASLKSRKKEGNTELATSRASKTRLLARWNLTNELFMSLCFCPLASCKSIEMTWCGLLCKCFTCKETANFPQVFWSQARKVHQISLFLRKWAWDLAKIRLACRNSLTYFLINWWKDWRHSHVCTPNM